MVILVVALIVFGPNKLPDLARQLGRGLREVRKLQESLRRDLDEVLADDEQTTSRPPTLPPKRAPQLEQDTAATPATPAAAKERDPEPAPDQPSEPTS